LEVNLKKLGYEFTYNLRPSPGDASRSASLDLNIRLNVRVISEALKKTLDTLSTLSLEMINPTSVTPVAESDHGRNRDRPAENERLALAAALPARRARHPG
jgi:hypothetical protein